MKDVGDQISSYPMFDGLISDCTLSDSCKEISCELPNAGLLSLSLSCSPVGVRIEVANTSMSPPEVESQLITDTGIFSEGIDVIVYQKTTEAFRLFMRADGVFEDLPPVVNGTYIPTHLVKTITLNIPQMVSVWYNTGTRVCHQYRPCMLSVCYIQLDIMLNIMSTLGPMQSVYIQYR